MKDDIWNILMRMELIKERVKSEEGGELIQAWRTYKCRSSKVGWRLSRLGKIT